MDNAENFPSQPIADLIDQYGNPVHKKLSAGSRELDRKIVELEVLGFKLERVEPVEESKRLYALINPEGQLALISHVS